MKVVSLVFCLVFVAQTVSGSPRRNTHDNIIVQDENPCSSVKILPRIVGGAPVRSEESAPYVAALGERLSNGSFSWFCGGSILSPIHILTAAHCLTNRNTDVVRVGALSLNKANSKNDLEVAGMLIHPLYKPPKSYNDVAIIRLKDRINFIENIKPICLADSSVRFDGRKAKVMGWGAEKVGGDGSQQLKQVEVEIVSNTKCDLAYQNSTISQRTFPDGVQDEQICAGSSKGGKDACQGDSGGPLVQKDDEGITRQIGIVSTGAGCGAKVYPGVYSRVSAYHEWIVENVRREAPPPMLEHRIYEEEW